MGESETPDNFERGDRGMRAMEFYASIGAANEEHPLGVPGWSNELYSVGDLIADLCHVVQRHGGSVEATITGALEHYGADVIEQAFQNDESWGHALQRSENVERAVDLMKAAGVPNAHHVGALRKVGLLNPLEADE